MNRIFLIVLIAMLTVHLPQPVRLVAQTAVPVTIVIRTADGAPVVDEEVRLIHQPSLTTETAVTNTGGQCVFRVPRGLYEVAFTPRLDAVSALAVAEGGLHGFGITVGDEAITYHFTFQADGYVYFDDTPAAATPSPIKPRLADLHFIGGAGQPTPTPLPPTEIADGAIQAMTPDPTVTATPGYTAVTDAGDNRFLLIISLIGITIGLIGFIVGWRRGR